MSAAVVFAAGAGCCAVLAVWEALAAAEEGALVRALARAAAPLRALGHGREPTAPERRRLAVVFGATLLGAGWLLAGVLAGLAAAAAGPWLLGRVIRARRRRWRAELAAGAPAVARALADALAGGHSIRGALTEVGRAGASTKAADAELDAAAAALELGDPTEVVLERLRRRAQDPAWDTIAAAVLLQRDAGGDLAGLLRALAVDLEGARRAEADARAATAQARFTAGLVAALPVGAAALAELAHPGALAQMTRQPLAAWMAGAAVVLQAFALVAVRRLSALGEAR